MPLIKNFLRQYFLLLIMGVLAIIHISCNMVYSGSILPIFDELFFLKPSRVVTLKLVDYSDIEYNLTWPNDLLKQRNQLLRCPDLGLMRRLNEDIRHRTWVNSATKALIPFTVLL